MIPPKDPAADEMIYKEYKCCAATRLLVVRLRAWPHAGTVRMGCADGNIVGTALRKKCWVVTGGGVAVQVGVAMLLQLGIRPEAAGCLTR